MAAIFLDLSELITPQKFGWYLKMETASIYAYQFTIFWHHIVLRDMRTCLRALATGLSTIMSELLHEMEPSFERGPHNIEDTFRLPLLCPTSQPLGHDPPAKTNWHQLNGITHWTTTVCRFWAECLSLAFRIIYVNDMTRRAVFKPRYINTTTFHMYQMARLFRIDK